ncbi:MAG TPA: ubiquinone/menaquinone biosynthesis methyltransferase [Candidatus Binataceae bacterium]|jgi:demethylmenaquinone methyltransferase/2-methoxy-6-polyprenyl-1,4-benzoquinol methylase
MKATAVATSTPDRGKARRIRDMFATIVPHYDLVNTLMTLGLDRRWRRTTVAMAEPAGAVALDIATGTGELAFELTRAGASNVIGVDFCHSMVETAVKKRAASNSAGRAVFATGDAMALPFRDATFDCIVNGFMLRNVADLDTTFRELCRVLRPGGRLVCLDLTPPRGPLRRFFDLYIATFVPLLGVLVGRKYSAYRYLFQSLTTHPDADALARMMRDAGFAEAKYRLTGFGTVAIHLGRKEAADLRLRTAG